MAINSDKYKQLIEEYFDGTICADDMIDLSKKLREDPSFRKQFDIQKEIQTAVSDQEYDAVKEMVHEIVYDEARPKEIEDEKVINLPTMKSFMRIAAVFILLLAIVTAVNFIIPKNNTSQQIVRSHFEPYESYVTFRSDDANLEEVAFSLYDTKQYNSAIEAFNELPNSDRIEFYKANALIANEQYDKAVIILETLISKSTLYTEAAKWYLALTYLGNKNENAARTLLDDISNSDSFFKSLADEVIKSL